jgi:hypothetical protein
MNCEEVQIQLLEYLDKSLDSITTKHVEIHLASCPPCRAEVESLADCVHQVAALPIVDPPLGFAQRVMAHAREIDLTPSIWQRSVLLIRNHFPLQAAGVVVIAIFSAYLYQYRNVEPPISKPFAPVPQMASLPERVEESIPNVPAGSQSSKTSQPAHESRAKTDLASRPGTPAVATRLSAASTAQPAPAAPMENREEGRFEGPKRAPIAVQGVTTGADNTRLIGDNFGFGALPMGGSRQPSLRAAPMPLNEPVFSMNEPTADVEFVVRRRPAQRRDQTETDGSESVRKSSETEASSSTAARRAAASSSLSGMIIETRWFTVAPEHFEQFKRDLTAQTYIESETATTKREKELTDKFDRPLAIKVMILPAIDR